MTRSRQPAPHASGRFSAPPAARTAIRPARLDRFGRWLSAHWLAILLVLLGVYVGLPWLAPVFMELGWIGAASAIYMAYASQCHQLPQRSFFLFGRQLMYTLADIQHLVGATDDPLILRRFIGNAELGWKVAWSDRMVAMYGSMVGFGLLYAFIRQRVMVLPWRVALLLVVPLALDGTIHLISDLSGIGNGFRDHNAWLRALTGGALPTSVYAGDTLGSFNSSLRLLSGVAFGVGVAWFGLPRIERLVATRTPHITAPGREMAAERSDPYQART